MNNPFEKEHNKEIIKLHFDFINNFFFDDIKDRVTYIAENDNKSLMIFVRGPNYFNKIGIIKAVQTRKNDDIEYLCGVLDFYSLFSTEEVKESIKDLYKNIIDLNDEICKGLFSEDYRVNLRIGISLNEKRELLICLENDLRIFSENLFAINTYCNQSLFFNYNYWKKVLCRLYKLERFMAFEDFKNIPFENIQEHLKLLSY